MGSCRLPQKKYAPNCLTQTTNMSSMYTDRCEEDAPRPFFERKINKLSAALGDFVYIPSRNCSTLFVYIKCSFLCIVLALYAYIYIKI